MNINRTTEVTRRSINLRPRNKYGRSMYEQSLLLLFAVLVLCCSSVSEFGSNTINEIQSEVISRLPRAVSVSTHPIPCNDYFNSIFVKKYPLATGFQLNYEHSFKPQRKLKPSGPDEFKVIVKLFLSRRNDETRSKNYLSATVFIPSDLNFKNAFQNRNRNHSHPRRNGITAHFRRDQGGEVITCLGPINSIILLASKAASGSKPGQQEIDFVIKNVPPSKTVQFYALFVMDTVEHEIIRDIVTLQTPKKIQRDDDDEQSATTFPIANINGSAARANQNYGRGIPNPSTSNNSDLNSSGNSSTTQEVPRSSTEATISIDQVEKQMGTVVKEVDAAARNSYRADSQYLNYVIPDYILHVRLIYTGCGSNYSCFEHPTDCHHTKNCLVNLRFNKFKGGVRMIITANTNNWVAVALSQDNLMGNDAVFICRRVPNSGKTSLWDAYNPPRPDAYSLGTVIHTEKHAFVRPTAGSSFNGMLTCDFQLDSKFKTESKVEINFVKKKYYILLAVGLDNKEPNGWGSVRKHEFAIVSSKSVHFYRDSPAVIQHQKHFVIMFHEQLAIITYGFLVPAAILMSRYGQHGFHQDGFGNFQWWLIVGATFHVCLQMAAIVCNALGFFIIYIFRTGSAFYTPSSIYHGIVGPTVYIMSFANAILGYFMYARKNRIMPESFCLKWTHWGIGHLSAFLGALELIRGPHIPKSWLSCSFSVVAGFSYILFVAANILLMFNTEILRVKLNIGYPSYRSFLGPAIELKTTAPKKTFYERRYIIFFTLASLFLCTIILLLELVLSEQTCSVNSKDYI